MSEVIKWQELEPEQRDRLIAEKVMGWQAKECDGEIGEQAISPDGWYCQKCGYSGSWGDDCTHEEIPPRYTKSLDRAVQVIRRFTVPVMLEWRGHSFMCKISAVFAKDEPSYGLSNDPAEAVCLAALKAVGVEIV